ncbi:glycoside hydrolase superfamily [Aspergillus sergii]|uniref:Glycoside hydrolase superfamily n=1 Tax=Aspergillus sergii TaxID=1034303 RepID=A0A5N6X5P3_9EURO|nr:glycoside hydrolase superfamily [Aspergillus sergii]
MQSTDLRKKVGQLFAVGFHGLTPSPEIKTLIHEYGLGGIVLFKRNISDAAQLQSLTHSLQEEARLAGHDYPLFIGIDQENGLVTRISPPIAAQLPGPMALGATYASELAKEVGTVTGETLRLFGINMNYAPVCDINSEPLNPVIGVRSFGDHPGLVGRLACATAQGLREQKVVPSVKHFPGHGDTAVDSHYGLPVISKTREQLDKCELRPFRRATAEGIEAVMTAHISLPSIDDSHLPATLSAEALNILRKDMNYDGMVITDCLEMDGIRASYGTEQGAVLALGAGCDSIMVCHTYDVQVGSIDKICEAVESGKVPTSRLEEAFRRVTALKARFLSWDAALKPQGLNGLTSLNQKGAKLAKEAYSSSVTLVRDTQSILPLSPSSRIAFLFPGDKTPAGGAVDGEGLGRKGSYNASVYLDILKQWNNQAFEIQYGPAGLSTEQLSLVEAADVVIFASINARESAYQRTLGLELPRRNRPMVAMALCNPYDFLEDSYIQTYVATYEPTVEAFTVAVELLFRPHLAKGSLPVGPEKPAPHWLEVRQYAAATDFSQVYDVWLAALPSYRVSADSLTEAITPPPHVLPVESHHLVARTSYPESKVVGFCLLFVAAQQDIVCVQLAALAVDPKLQGRGVGTALLAECRAWMEKTFKKSRLELGSTFPRFWPGLPIDLPTEVQEFFVHRGFQLNPPVPRSVDLYQDIKEFQSPELYVTRAKERGYTFRPLETADYQECLVGQEKNFSYNQAWVQMYHKLDPSKYPSSVMTAFDPNGKQVGWTLMLSHESPMLKPHWAFPSLCGPKTGLIGCVGVDADYRKEGVGLALLCHAIEDMKQRGVEGVFVDWVSLEGWYEKLGFKVWWSCRTGAMQLDA